MKIAMESFELSHEELELKAEVVLLPWDRLGSSYQSASIRTVHSYLLRNEWIPQTASQIGLGSGRGDTASDRLRNFLAAMVRSVRLGESSTAMYDMLDPIEQDFANTLAHQESLTASEATIVRGGLAGILAGTTGQAVDPEKLDLGNHLPGEATEVWVDEEGETCVGTFASHLGVVVVTISSDDGDTPELHDGAEGSTSDSSAELPPSSGGTGGSSLTGPSGGGDGQFSELIDFIGRACARLDRIVTELKATESVPQSVRETLGPINGAIEERQQTIINAIQSGRHDAMLRDHGLANDQDEWRFKLAAYAAEESRFDTHDAHGGDSPAPDSSDDSDGERGMWQRFVGWVRPKKLLRHINTILKSVAAALVPGGGALVELKEAVEHLVEDQAEKDINSTD